MTLAAVSVFSRAEAVQLTALGFSQAHGDSRRWLCVPAPVFGEERSGLIDLFFTPAISVQKAASQRKMRAV